MCLISSLKAFSLTRKQVLDQRKCYNEECSEISDVKVSENKNENAFAPMHSDLGWDFCVGFSLGVKYYSHI